MSTKQAPYLLFGLVLLTLLTSGCETPQEEIKLGFAAGLTGQHSSLAVSGRDGVILAVEEINNKGGINGHPVMLLTRDNKQDAQIAARVHQELIDEDVVAIIGHMTSAMSVAAMPVSNKNKVLMVSPTTSTDSITGIDDYFFRVMATSKTAIQHLAQYLFNKQQLRQVAVLYDTSNAAFSIDWLNIITAYYKERGEGQVIPIPYRSGKDTLFSGLLTRVLAYNPDGVVIVSSANDAARICQQFKLQQKSIPLFATMWSMTDDFLRNAGTAGEGIVFAHWFIKDYPAPSSIKFRRNFEHRFGHAPNFASYFSYEAAQVILTALQKNSDPALLRQTITQIQTFQGTQGEVHIDAFGDPDRKVFLMTVRNGQFRSLE